jgi:hypothetical protein
VLRSASRRIGFEPAYLEGLEVVCRMWELDKSQPP